MYTFKLLLIKIKTLKFDIKYAITLGTTYVYLTYFIKGIRLKIIN